MNSIKNIMKKRMALLLSNIFIVTLTLFNVINPKIKPLIEAYSVHECDNLLSRIISVTVEEQVSTKIKNELIVYGDNKQIEFNTYMLNSIMSNTMKELQYYLYKLDGGNASEEMLGKIGIDVDKQKLNKGIVYEIPLYRLTNNFLLANMGISIPISLKMIGKITGEIVSNVKEYGINNAIVELKMNICSVIDVISPFVSNNHENITSIPLSIKVIQGEVPSFYYGGKIVGGEL